MNSLGSELDSREEKGCEELTQFLAVDPTDAMSHCSCTSDTLLCMLQGGLEDQGMLKCSFNNLPHSCNHLHDGMENAQRVWEQH